MLEGDKVRLAPLRDEDSDEFAQWINDRELVLNSAPYRPITEAAHRDWYASVGRREDTAIFAIRLLEDDRLIGSCSLKNIDAHNRSAEAQVRIGVDVGRGKGYGTEALALLVRHGFEDRNLHRQWAHLMATNGAALRYTAKVGFQTEGILRKALFIDGEWVDVHTVAILREDYDALRRAGLSS